VTGCDLGKNWPLFEPEPLEDKGIRGNIGSLADRRFAAVLTYDLVNPGIAGVGRRASCMLCTAAAQYAESLRRNVFHFSRKLNPGA
jgi:hypothetical protein